MTDLSRRLAAAYDHAAAAFAVEHRAMPEALALAAASLLARLPPQPRILDLGCGTGRDMAWLEARGAQVTGVDLSAGMLAQARGIVAGPLLQGEMGALAFPDASFEAVWCCASLLHVPKAEAPVVLREVRRVLTANGLLFLSLQEGTGEGWERGPMFGGHERLMVRYTLPELEELLVTAGFAVLERGRNAAGPVSWLNVLAGRMPAGPRSST